MRVILQRVHEANVEVNGEIVGQIKNGWLALVAIKKGDQYSDVRYIAKKVIETRAFPDSEEKMNLSVQETGGEILVVSQFTLYGDCRKGRRPSFQESASGPEGLSLYNELVQTLKTSSSLKIETGSFGKPMTVHMKGHGPVTLLIDSPEQPPQ